ncbi:MAG: tRNA preQ1(34) S-adenosylmethionine ribosyltransferase-isomerase QueA [Myxococcota bacterium]|nr:tRNA preQ1(34) S-adenosylmethionine ribosyltransferase-isomerase QueA [Myxococcota bacterium]
MSDMHEADARLAPFDYRLPDECIARFPPKKRDGGRLLVSDGGRWTPHSVADLADWFQSGDVLVVNDTRVLNARLFGRRATGGSVEFLVLDPSEDCAKAMVRPSKKIKVGEEIAVLTPSGEPSGHTIRVGQVDPNGHRHIHCSVAPMALMDAVGVLPLPPYFGRDAQPADAHRYQTVFASEAGAVAAPTASLHLTRELLQTLDHKGVEVLPLTLHVGAGTFRNLRPHELDSGVLHTEQYVIPDSTAAAINRAKAGGRRVTAVGTTVTRALEAAFLRSGVVQSGAAQTDLFIQAGHTFRVVDRLMTNFHLPRSSLLMLVCAFGGREHVLNGYDVAIRNGFRFYSYGDAMLLSPAAEAV